MITIANWISDLMVFSVSLLFIAIAMFIIYLLIITMFNK